MRYLLALVLVLVASSATAQETYSQNATAGNVVELRAVVTADNEDACERLGQPEDCNQAQACVAGSAAGGASCSAAQARAASARIYPDTEAGRNEYVLHKYVMPAFNAAKARIAQRHALKLCRFWSTANTTQKNAVCAAVGQPNGCEVCP